MRGWSAYRGAAVGGHGVGGCRGGGARVLGVDAGDGDGDGAGRWRRGVEGRGARPAGGGVQVQIDGKFVAGNASATLPEATRELCWPRNVGPPVMLPWMSVNEFLVCGGTARQDCACCLVCKIVEPDSFHFLNISRLEKEKMIFIFWTIQSQKSKSFPK